MNDTSLDFYRRENIFDGSSKSRESIDTGNADILHSTILEIVTHLLPEGSRFGISNVESEDFFHSSRIDSKNEVHSFRFDSGIFLDFEMNGIQKDDRIKTIKHPSLPFLNIRKNLVGDITHEISGNLCSVDVLNIFLDVCGGESKSVHADDLCFNLIGSSLKLLNNLRFELCVPITRDIKLYWAISSEKHLTVRSVSRISCVVS